MFSLETIAKINSLVEIAKAKNYARALNMTEEHPKKKSKKRKARY